MGKPNAAEMEILSTIVIAALNPNGKVKAAALRESGLHKAVLQSCYDALKPEIGNLVGWKPLRDYGYSGYRKDSKAEAGELTAKWHTQLMSQNLGDEMAILIYDGETLPPPARDYRLFLLRDGRLLYYYGGFYANRWHTSGSPAICGDVLEVLQALDRTIRPWPSLGEEPFVVMMKAFSTCLKAAIDKRRRFIDEQEKLNGRIEQLLSRLAD